MNPTDTELAAARVSNDDMLKRNLMALLRSEIEKTADVVGIDNAPDSLWVKGEVDLAAIADALMNATTI